MTLIETGWKWVDLKEAENLFNVEKQWFFYSSSLVDFVVNELKRG